MRNKRTFWQLFIGAAIYALLGSVFLLQPVRALPPRPLAPTPTPLPTLPTTVQSIPAGAQIELRTRFPTVWPWDEIHWQELWTVVQWQDNAGQWHDVIGWRGTPDSISVDAQGNLVGHKTWWVAEEDLGRGTFRWLVYREKGGVLLATGDKFTLPAQNGLVTQVNISLTYR